MKVDPAAVTDALTQLEDGLGGADALKAQLSDAGVTRAQVEAFAGRLFLVNEVQKAVAKDRVDEAALRDAYQANLAQLTTVEVEHILVADKADAERIAAEVTPATFAETAKKESIDPGSAQQGGSLGGPTSLAQFQTQFDPDFVAATMALQPGEISGPVKTQFGWHVIHLVRRDVAPFEDVRPQLEANQANDGVRRLVHRAARDDQRRREPAVRTLRPRHRPGAADPEHRPGAGGRVGLHRRSTGSNAGS